MPEVSGLTLSHAIRAIDEKMWALQLQIEKTDQDDELPDLEMDYLGFMKAAHALRTAYEEARKLSDNLLPYENLVREL